MSSEIHKHIETAIEKKTSLLNAKVINFHQTDIAFNLTSGTSLVWQKLEEQNPDFFMAYHVRVKLKDQVVLFNHLLEQQMQMIQKMQSSHMGGAWQQKPGMGQAIQHPHLSNGFPMHPMHTGLKF